MIQWIMGVSLPHPFEGQDKISWHHTSTEAFSIKSAYKILKFKTLGILQMKNGNEHGSY